MNLLFRFYDAQKGDVLIDGKSIYNMSRQELRSHMGIVLQDPYLFSGTIGSNVSLDDERMTEEDIKKHCGKSVPSRFWKSFQKALMNL